ncbi:hypothetical protein EOM09_08255, partial [bacterium]|nr:hypothetical protein [bacterium]
MISFYKDNIINSNIETLNELEDKINLISKNNILKEKYFLKVTADFSGIQDFIFTIDSQKALKNLKVRSFLISYFSNLISSFIIEELNLSYANIIFSTGGKFELLIANTEEFKNKTINIINNFNKYLFETFEEKLFLSLRFEELSSLDFSIFSIKNEDELNDKNSIIPKKRKFENLIKEEKENFFIKNDGRECSSCHKTTNKISDYKDLKEICPTCI